jgi:hypothetical protein
LRPGQLPLPYVASNETCQPPIGCGRFSTQTMSRSRSSSLISMRGGRPGFRSIETFVDAAKKLSNGMRCSLSFSLGIRAHRRTSSGFGGAAALPRQLPRFARSRSRVRRRSSDTHRCAPDGSFADYLQNCKKFFSGRSQTHRPLITGAAVALDIAEGFESVTEEPALAENSFVRQKARIHQLIDALGGDSENLTSPLWTR